jgi:hypothetical protein
MPRNLFRRSLKYLALMLTLSCTAAAVHPKEQSASAETSVGAHAIHKSRLGNLPGGTLVTIGLESSGELAVLLVDKRDFTAFPDVERPVFRGSLTDKLKFSITTPASGEYFLIVDNREGGEARDFTLSVKASFDTTRVEAAVETLQREFQKFEDNLRQFFVFDDMQIKIAKCGTSNVFNSGDTVILCTEIAEKLRKAVDTDQARDALVFMLLHETGHVLLQQWGYPFYANEELVDEFTTALLVMFQQGERARSQAELFKNFSPDQELALKRDRDDRHPLSVQRARNILGWVEDPELVRRWQKIFVPHMQTAVLEKLRQHPKDWADLALVDKELKLRRPADD